MTPPIDGTSDADAPASPLHRLVGSLSSETADTARERSEAWRQSFDETISPDEG